MSDAPLDNDETPDNICDLCGDNPPYPVDENGMCEMCSDEVNCNDD